VPGRIVTPILIRVNTFRAPSPHFFQQSPQSRVPHADSRTTRPAVLAPTVHGHPPRPNTQIITDHEVDAQRRRRYNEAGPCSGSAVSRNKAGRACVIPYGDDRYSALCLCLKEVQW